MYDCINMYYQLLSLSLGQSLSLSLPPFLFLTLPRAFILAFSRLSLARSLTHFANGPAILTA